MRFTIKIDENWLVSITCASGRTWERQLAKAPDGRGGFFPVCVEQAAPAPDAEASGGSGSPSAQTDRRRALCEGNADVFWEVYGRITRRTHEAKHITDFGRYLFDTLLGKSLWEEMLSEAAEEDFIELCLSWGRSETYLHRLPWEMMRGANDFFLVCGIPKLVAITRLVADTKHVTARQISPQPRLLFIIGTSLTDEQIRPGAEYLSLLRQFRLEQRSFHSRVLQRASPLQMKQELKRFEPDVVYFICHGGIDSKTGRGYLSLELDASEKEAPGDEEAKEKLKRRDAEQLLSMLKVTGQPPPIVVLSACYSAGGNKGLKRDDDRKGGKMLGAHDAAPLAAELVAGGVPVVIGMSGEISDLACRLFTRQFGTALVSGDQLVRATGEGRCAAFSEGLPPQDSVDWAFPAVFMAEGVGPDYAPLPPEAVLAESTAVRWIRGYDIDRLPVFCSRDEFFDAFYQLFQPHEPPALVAYTESNLADYGKTRILQQLAVTALREGHIPCIVSSELDDWKPPQNIAQLCVELLRAIGKAREVIGLPPPLKGSLLRYLRFVAAGCDAYRVMCDRMAQIEDAFSDAPQACFDNLMVLFPALDDIIEAEGVRAILRTELKSLIDEARQAHPNVVREDGRVLVMLDEVHRYDKAFIPLFYKLLDDFGLGTDEEPVPVVMALSKGTPADEYIRPVQEKLRSRFRFMSIPEFGDDEYMLVYQQVLMTPFLTELYEDISDKPWVFNYNASEEIIQKYKNRLRKRLKRIPEDFFSDRLFITIEDARDEGFALPVDDEARLAALNE
ncbi:MAG TPA: CHAT domain-containing protein [Pyrinomonadaceae bacterium]|nr:CHAT domain-containing protein [Pyrinomonadaceae bacterium]